MSVPHVAQLQTDVETSFATDQAYTWRDQALVEGSFASDLKVNHIPDPSVVGSLHQHNQFRMGSQFGSSCSADILVEGLPAALATGQAYSAPQNSVLEIFAAAFGGVYGDSGSTVLGAGATTSSIPVQVGHGARFSKGGACIIGGELMPIENVVGDTLTLKYQLNVAPANTTPVYNCATVFLDPDTFGDDGYSLAMLLIGELLADQWICRGVQPTLTFGGAFDALLSAKCEFAVTQWEKINTETLGTPAPVGAGGMPLVAGYVKYGNVGDALRYVIEADSWTLNPGLRHTPSRALSGTGGGVQTITRYKQLRQAATANIRIPAYVEMDEWFTDDAAGQLKYLLVQFGTAPVVAGVGTGVVAFELPTCEITATPKMDRTGELIHTSIDFRARLDEDVTSPTTAIHRSPVRVHFG